MSEVNEQAGATASELDVLKARARLMGISFSNNIGLEALRERVNSKIASEGDEDEDEIVDADAEVEPEAAGEANGLEAPAEIAAAPKPKTPTKAEARMAERQSMIREQLKLVRCRIQNLDPKKANLPGEIFTVANRVIGTVRKFIPYGEVTDDGYHIPYILYQELESRRFLNIRTNPTRGGNIQVRDGWAKEFAIEVLPPLTPAELKDLATAQIAAGTVESN